MNSLMPELKQLTMQEVMRRMRQLGYHISPDKLKAGMDAGVYAFGKIIKMPGRKNCVAVIFESDFNRWISEKQV